MQRLSPDFETGSAQSESPFVFPSILFAIVVAIFSMAAFAVTESRMKHGSGMAAASDASGQLQTNVFVPSLMFMTLGAALLIAIGSFAYFLRKRSQRQAAKRALTD